MPSRGRPAAVDAAAEALAVRVREEIARRRLSRQAVADAAKVSLSTLEKALAGRRPFTLQTIVRLEAALGVALRTPEPGASEAAGGSAPDAWGGYGRPAVAWLEGAHLTLRPSFGDSRAVYAYRTDVTWDLATSTLTFRETERLDRDYVQFGTVAVPHQSGHVYLVTNRHGQHRLVMLSRPTITGEMYGILSTLVSGRGSHLAPVATPIVLKPIAAGERPVYGTVPPGHAAHAGYARLLRRAVADHFATLLPLGGP